MQRRTALQLAAGWAGAGLATQSALASPAMAHGGPNAAVLRLPLAKGLSPRDCVQSMQLRANLLNMKQVGDLPLSEQVQAMTGKPQRLIRVFLFCDPPTAVQMVDGSLDFAAYLPCRITLVEDENGKFWLVMMNLQPLIDSVPPGSPLRAKAEAVGKTLMRIMRAGARGAL
ncbi:MAG: DUF302 domain-containing protein [Burkholderiaceae bacterium]|jgi:hypothetical protein|nr:DUF302 domain-containing protein [Burkholderiaceae bacterium]